MHQIDLNILLIDDDPVFILYSKKTIESTGCAVKLTVCAHGQAALQHLANTKQDISVLPHIIFLDIDMPVMDGWLFLEEYERLETELRKNAVLYIVTSSPDAFEINKSRQYESVKGYLVKPVSKEKFRQLFSSFST